MFDDAVFICGCGHSGTTLVAMILSTHPEIFVPMRETELFRDPRKFERRLDRLRAEYEVSGRRILAEKTPRHIRDMRKIRAAVPGCRFVIPVRDGRDVTASIKRRVGSAQAGSNRWIKDVWIALNERSAADVLVYRHEDLVRDTVPTLKRICAFVGVEYFAELLRYHERADQWSSGRVEAQPTSGAGLSHGPNRAWQVSQPIFDSSGRWSTELTADEIAPLLRGRGKHLMRSFGYLTDLDALGRPSSIPAHRRTS